MLLHVHQLAVSYGANSVLNNINFTINPSERVGLVGANGVGKSTLLKCITGTLTPDDGNVRVQSGVDVGYLPQEIPAPEGKTVQHLLDEALMNIRALAAQMYDLEAQMAHPDADLDSVFEAYNAVTEAFELSGGYETDSRVEQVLAGLNVAYIDRERLLSTLSGGERSRVGLAAMLVRAPGLLLLDEPTNHIDNDTLAWLENYLAMYRGGVLMVSHDRAFLNATVNRIIEIDEHTREAASYAGNYDFYAEEKARQVAQWHEDYTQQQEELKLLRNALKSKHHTPEKRNIKSSDGDKFIKHFKDQTADKTLSRELGNIEERLRRIEADLVPRPPKPLSINPDLDPATLRGHFPITVSGVSKAYNGRCILHDFSLSVSVGERIAITGANGTGKSTLMKIIAGKETPDSGSVTIAPSVRLGYLPQVDSLSGKMTLIEAYGVGLEGGYEDHKANLISSGLFTYPQLDTPVHGMSAGQRRKLLLARLIAQQANVLLLDEPTNHLSFDVVEGFEAALEAFEGTVIAISHDRRFLERFSGRQLQL